MSIQNDTEKQKIFCPYCNSKNIIFRGRYLSVANYKRIEKFSSLRHQRLLKEMYPETYQSIVEDNDGTYPTREQLVKWDTKQRIKCLSCNKSFLKDGSSPRSKYRLSIFFTLDSLLRDKFISKNQFVNFYRRGVESSQYLYSPRIVREVYEDTVAKYLIHSHVRQRKNDPDNNNLYFFMIKKKHRNLKKEIRIILGVYSKTLDVKTVIFNDEPELLKRNLEKSLEIFKDTIINLPPQLLRRIGVTTHIQSLPEVERKVILILDEYGFNKAVGSGANLSTCKKIVSYFFTLYNRCYLNYFKRNNTIE